MFTNRRWLVIPTSITASINFDQVYQSSADMLRVSLDGNSTFIKYDVNEVTSAFDTINVDPETGEETTTTTEVGVYGRPDIYSSSYIEYNHSEILALLAGSNWTEQIDGE